MSLVEEALHAHPPAGLSLAQKVEAGFEGAGQQALALLDRKPTSGLSIREWAEHGLESAQKTVQMVEELVKQRS